jgi:hypothetical protein
MKKKIKSGFAMMEPLFLIAIIAIAIALICGAVSGRRQKNKDAEHSRPDSPPITNTEPVTVETDPKG